jgi:hypothetical protein
MPWSALPDLPAHMMRLKRAGSMAGQAVNDQAIAGNGDRRAQCHGQGGADLLRDTTATIETIAHQTGYASPFAFSAAFKRRFGQPPRQYRQELPLVPVQVMELPLGRFGVRSSGAACAGDDASG